MNKQRTRIVDYGQQLPPFESIEEAQRVLFERRDVLLALLSRIVQPQDPFRCDASPESLKTLEAWYFDLLHSNQFVDRGVSKAEFEEAASMYFCAVLVKNHPVFDWSVQEFSFVRGRYSIGVAKPLAFIAARAAIGLDRRPNNKRRQSLWREYQQYAAM